MSPRHNSPSQEFLDGCLRLKGMARSIDVHFIMVPRIDDDAVDEGDGEGDQDHYDDAEKLVAVTLQV